MSAIMNLVAKPTRLVMYSPRCSYCGVDNSGPSHDGCDAYVGPRMAVLACAAHKDLAKRDGGAWMHKNGIVQREDVLNDPIFAALGMTEDHWFVRALAPKNLTVKRSSGLLEPGWAFRCLASWYDPLALQRDDEGKWRIPAEGPGGLTKSIIADELTLSLPEDKHDLVSAFVARLDAGIYKADADAHDEAVAAGATGDAGVEPANIQTVFAPQMGGHGRVCYPPTPEGRKVEGAA
jgi:hypothetical protein